MNRKVVNNYTELAYALGLKYDNINNVIYGKRNEFDLVIYASDSRYPYLFTIYTSAKSSNSMALSKGEIKEFTKSIKQVISLNQDGNHFTVVQRSIANQEKLKTWLGETLDGLTSFLRSKSYTPCCQTCGKPVETNSFLYGTSYINLCADCETSMRQGAVASQQEKGQKQENVIGGIVGALLGSLVGVVCIVLLSELGYVAALSGVVMAVCTLKGYELLGGKLTKKGIVISIIVMLFMTWFGDMVDWAIVIYKEVGAGYGYSIFECYRMIPSMLSGGFIEMGNYIANLVLLYLFLLIGAIPQIISMIKGRKVENRMIRITDHVTLNDVV